jgi:hypothetical protein
MFMDRGAVIHCSTVLVPLLVHGDGNHRYSTVYGSSPNQPSTNILSGFARFVWVRFGEAGGSCPFCPRISNSEVCDSPDAVCALLQ